MNAHLDMSKVIVPKSDQINADDLISGPMTITINEVRIKGGQEQPVDIYFEGDKRAYRPCKSMSRVLVHVWGADAGKYIGRSLTLYRDPNVRFGKDAVGGIRISHMTDIPEDKLDNGRVIMQLTATRAQRKPHVVQPLAGAPKQNQADKIADGVKNLIQRIGSADPSSLRSITGEPDVIKQRAWLAKNRPELAAKIDAAIAAKAPPADDSPFGGDTFEGFDDAPVHQPAVDKIRELISSATDQTTWEAAKAEFLTHAQALPKDVADQLETALNQKRAELGGDA